jgi:dCMP deaminase
MSTVEAIGERSAVMYQQFKTSKGNIHTNYRFLDKWDERFLELAATIAKWSKDPSTQVGAVIANKKRVISLGFNGFPERIQDKERILSTREQKYERIIHAEINAILFAKQDLKGMTLYTYPFMPCSRCASVIIQSGLSEVVTPWIDFDSLEYARWFESFLVARDMFQEAGVTLNFSSPLPKDQTHA